MQKTEALATACAMVRDKAWDCCTEYQNLEIVDDDLKKCDHNFGDFDTQLGALKTMYLSLKGLHSALCTMVEQAQELRDAK